MSPWWTPVLVFIASFALSFAAIRITNSRRRRRRRVEFLKAGESLCRHFELPFDCALCREARKAAPVVWEMRVDEHYRAVVVRKESHLGTLELWERDALLFEQSVGISFDAKYGPDVCDVREWQKTVRKFLNKRKE